MLAAVVFEAEAHTAVRAAMQQLRGTRETRKLHWNEMNGQQQHNAAKTVADLRRDHRPPLGGRAYAQSERATRRQGRSGAPQPLAQSEFMHDLPFST